MSEIWMLLLFWIRNVKWNKISLYHHLTYGNTFFNWSRPIRGHSNNTWHSREEDATECNTDFLQFWYAVFNFLDAFVTVKFCLVARFGFKRYFLSLKFYSSEQIRVKINNKNGKNITRKGGRKRAKNVRLLAHFFWSPLPQLTRSNNEKPTSNHTVYVRQWAKTQFLKS